MTNFEHAVGATNSALESSGTAFAQNEAYMSGIEAKITSVTAAFQKMSTAVVDSDLIKGVLDITKSLAEFGSTDVGSAITQILLLSGVSWGGLQLLGQSILPGIINSFKLLSGVSISALAAETGVSTLAVALSASLPYILAVTTAIVGLIAVVKGIKSAYEEANPSVEQAYTNMQEAKEELASTEKKYTEAKNKLEELNATPFEDRTVEIQAEIDELTQLVAYYKALKENRAGDVVGTSQTYARTVEKKGIAVGFQGAKDFESYDNEGLLIYTEKQTQSYKTLAAAIYEAAKAQYEYDGTLIDVSNLSSAQKQLERLGWSFEESTISISDLQNQFQNFYNSIEDGEKLTPSLIDQYKDLSDNSKQYAEALQIMKDNGIELNAEQESFLSTFNNVNAAYENYIGTQAEAEGVTRAEIEVRYEAASALSAYAQELINAANAYQIFKDRLSETGDYDDSFKGLASIFSELNGEYEKGQVGSTAFLTALELLTGQSFTSAEAVDYMNTHLDTLQLLFGDSESGGMGLITALQDLGYATLDADGNLQVSIDDFSSLASKLGISEGALYSLTEALRVMGIDFQYNVEDILTNIDGLKEGITSVQDGITHVDFEAFVSQAQALGMANDEILVYKNLLEQVANTKLDNVEAGMEKLQPKTEDANSEVEGLDSDLEGLNDFDSSGVVGSLDAIGDAASSAASKVGTLGGALEGLGGVEENAEGTNYAEEGDSLVNEEGPELIQSRDKAYIAGGGLPTITHLHRGDKVYTAEETKDILKGGELSNPIQAHEKGTLKDGGSSKKITINGGTASIAASLLAGLKGQSRGTTSGSSSSSSSSTSSSSLPQSSSQGSSKDEFDEWLKAKKHSLAMDEITEEQYYTELEKMNEKYFKNSKEYQDEYWKYQEEVYKWRKSQLDDENKLLEKQIDLEKALSELAKAKEQKILVYKDGRFQYIQDIDAIDEAQRNVAKLKSEAGYASGTTNASAGIHLVGENGPELRVLNSGDGIIPADATKNLLSLAQMNGVKLGDGLNKAMQILYSFDISNLSLPNVRNATEFFEGLKNYAYQYSYAQ